MDAARPVLWPKFNRFRGDTKRLRFTLTDDLGALLRPSAHTLLFSLVDGAGELLVQKSSEVGGVEIVDDDAGLVDVELVPADDEVLELGTAYACVLQAQHLETAAIHRVPATLKLVDGVSTATELEIPTNVVNPDVPYGWGNISGKPAAAEALDVPAGDPGSLVTLGEDRKIPSDLLPPANGFDGEFDSLANVPTTVQGYGITDAVVRVPSVSLLKGFPYAGLASGFPVRLIANDQPWAWNPADARPGNDVTIIQPTGLTGPGRWNPVETIYDYAGNELVQGREHAFFVKSQLRQRLPTFGLFFGDSTMLGAGNGVASAINYLHNVVGITLQDHFPSVTVQNVAVGGVGTQYWRDHVDEHLALNPTFYVVKLGANDATLAPDACLTNYEYCLSRIRASKTVAQLTIVLITPNSMNDTPNGRNEAWFKRIVRGIIALGRRYQCVVIDDFSMHGVDPRHAAGYMDTPYAATLTAGSFVTGTDYTIATLGTTDFTLVGAEANRVGVVFRATGPGTGTGTAADSRHVHPKDDYNLSLGSVLLDILLPRALRTNYGYARHANYRADSLPAPAAFSVPPSSVAYGLSQFLSSGGGWGFTGQVVSFRSANDDVAQLAFNRGGSGYQIRSSASGSTWNTALFVTNADGVTIPLFAAVPPSSYAPGTHTVSVTAASGGWPTDGFLFVVVHIGGGVSQLLFSQSAGTGLFYMRHGFGSSWSNWTSLTGNNSGDESAAIALKAPLASPALTGTPTAPTASGGTASTQLATTAFVANALAALIASAPGALDTLDELAAAFGDDPNFAATMTTALATKLAKASNLADLTDAAAARGNLGLGTAALAAASAFEVPLTFNGGLTRSGNTVALTSAVEEFGFVFDAGAGGVLVASSAPPRRIKKGGTLTGWYLRGDVSGSVTIALKKATGGGSLASITGAGAKPQLVSAVYAAFSDLTGWTTAFSAGDWFVAEITGTPAALQQVTLVLTYN